MRRILFVLICLTGLVALFFWLPYWFVQDDEHPIPIWVTGTLVTSTDGTPVAGAFVLTAPSRSEARARVADGAHRERTDEWIARERALRATGREAEGSRPTPWGSCGAYTKEDGTFEILQIALMSADAAGERQSRLSRPPPQPAIGVLAIEIEGRAPVILDVPEGTWTQYDSEDGLWATWDLGVVEVPSTP